MNGLRKLKMLRTTDRQIDGHTDRLKRSGQSNFYQEDESRPEKMKKKSTDSDNCISRRIKPTHSHCLPSKNEVLSNTDKTEKTKQRGENRT